MKKKKQMFRRVVQAVFFVFLALIAVNHTLAEGGKGIPLISDASLHAVCPFGGIVTLYQLLTVGTYVQKIHASSLILAIIVMASAIALGPIFCGWICPFGSFQDLLAALGKRIFPKRHNRFIPSSLDRWLRYLRYVVLILVIVVTARSAKLMFSQVDPYYALFQFWTGEVALPAFIALGVVIAASLFVDRPFCKYACPYGALLGMTNIFRFIPLKRNQGTCISCNACDRACPMNIPVSSQSSVRNHQCISCFECTSTDGACPVDRTMEFRTGSFPEVGK